MNIKKSSQEKKKYKLEPFRKCNKCGNRHMELIKGFWACTCGNIVRIKAIINGRLV